MLSCPAMMQGDTSLAYDTISYKDPLGKDPVRVETHVIAAMLYHLTPSLNISNFFTLEICFD